MKKPTPTTHGAWRVRKGVLVDESAQPAPAIEQTPGAPLVASPDLREGGPGVPVPPADAPNRPRPRGRTNPPKE